MSVRFWVALIAAIIILGPVAARAELSTVDRVAVKNGHIEEARFYYEHNWKRLRALAQEEGFISGFSFMIDARVPGQETLLLITRYADRDQYEQREANFEIVINADDEGLKLLNDLAPAEFREVTPLGLFEVG
jgi:hypothetical protein